MRLTFRPLSTFLGFVDLKVGVILAIIFALVNKVAGVYGLIASFTGVSGAQLSLYIYSTILLVAFVWGLRAVKDEDAQRSLYFAHAFALDHAFSSAWTAYFALDWWLRNPHDGKRIANSAAQEEIAKVGGAVHVPDEELRIAAQGLWRDEKGLAAAVLILGWLIKLYFVVIIYSYAARLRKGSYYRPLRTPATSRFEGIDGRAEEHVPLTSRTPNTPGSGSVSSFAEFVAAPGRKQHGRGRSRLAEEIDPADEVLFDSDEPIPHSKDTTSVSTDEDSRP